MEDEQGGCDRKCRGEEERRREREEREGDGKKRREVKRGEGYTGKGGEEHQRRGEKERIRGE